MGLTEISGLPAHVLLVHAVVVLVPLTAVLVVVTACSPAARHRLGAGVPVVALVTLVSVPLATNSGEWLERRVPPSPLVRLHTQLGDTMLPWAIALFVVALIIWGQRFLPPRLTLRPGVSREAPRAAPSPALTRLRRATRTHTRVGVMITVLTAVLALTAGAGSVVQIYRIGESGSRAVWTGNFSEQPTQLLGRPPNGQGPPANGG
jgi:hypothetical protein